MTMGRTVDQDVHAAFVEFRAKEEDKCLSVQCIYCQQIRAKNTSRQKQHLLECPGLQNHPNAPRPQTTSSNGIAAPNGYGTPTGPGTSAAPLMNGLTPHATPMQNAPMQSASMQTAPMQSIPNRPSLPAQNSTAGPSTATPVQRPLATPKTPKTTTKTTPGSSLPAPPLDDVHAAFVEFRAKEEDKCLSVQCIYCNQIRAKNTSRQRQHLQECPTYLNVMKDSIPANNLLHRFDEGDIARSLQLPTPALELDFRISVKLNPRVSVGPGMFGHRNWVSFIGGQWAGRWGKGVVIPGGQDSQLIVKELATRVSANYLLQTNDEPPAFITVKSSGWLTGAKDVLEKLQDPLLADTINPNTYKFRLNIELETGDERYAFVNTCTWVGSGCRRGAEGEVATNTNELGEVIDPELMPTPLEVIYDAYRIT